MKTEVTFNPAYFDSIMRSQSVERLTRAKAREVLDKARHSAPVGDPSDPVYRKPDRRPGQYRDGLSIDVVPARYRNVYRVVGRDPKTLLVESKTHNLARALEASK